MFLISTWHFAMNGYHVFYGFVNHVGDEGGAVGYINNLRRWDDVMTNTLYATQEILGGAAAVGALGLVSLGDSMYLRVSHFRYIDVSFCGTRTGESLRYR